MSYPLVVLWIWPPKFFYPTFLGGFRYLEIPFDIVSKGILTAYSRDILRLMPQLRSIGFKNMMVAMTNHSDSDRGDLFLGTAANGQAWASLPSEVRIHTFFVNITNA